MIKHFLFGFLCLAVLARAQDQSGFISIDCGLTENSTYIDSKTGILYLSDAEYIQTASNNTVSKTISPLYQTADLDQQLLRVRSFPAGTKNCYTITHPRLKDRSRYFLRARFMYGNYDNKVKLPVFDLYFGVNFWATVNFTLVDTVIDKEILYAPKDSSEYTYVCLVNTENGTPFISALEIRLVDDDIYVVGDESETLQLFNRYDLKSSEKTKVIRYKDDIFDRLWQPSFFRRNVMEINTTSNFSGLFLDYYIPFIVMGTALTPENASNPINFSWTPRDPTAGYYFFMHFADYQRNLTREFNITINKEPWETNFEPSGYFTDTVSRRRAETPASQVNVSFIRTAKSELPPILNALEIYTVRHFSDQLTDQEDLNAILEVKAAYGLKRDWQGDPCLPTTWESIGCFNITTADNPRIISLNLSQSELTGKISSTIFKLNLLTQLDLSNNSLTGEVPAFLAQMENLDTLILSGNNLSGIVPAGLVEKSKNNLLKLSVDGNPNLCITESCETEKDTNTPASSSPPPPPTSSKTASRYNDTLFVTIFAAVASVMALSL